MKHLGLFAAGVLFGTAGLKILSSKDAKKVYSHTTAAVLRAKDCVMQAVTNVREDATPTPRTSTSAAQRKRTPKSLRTRPRKKRTRNKSQESRDARLSFTFGGIDTL